MRGIAFALVAFVAGGCAQDMRSRGPAFFADNLKDITVWDAQRGAEGHPAYDEMMTAAPNDAIPVLILKLEDTTPTAIQDRIYEPPTVGHVAFHILMRRFGMKADQFQGEGVWTMTSHPSKNPIYMVKFGDDNTRARLGTRFRTLATEKGWY